MDQKRKNILVATFIISFLLLLLYATSLKLHLFFTTPWIDIPNHILGGVITALIGFLIFSSKFFSIEENKMLLSVIIFTIFVGGLWEIFEEVVGLTSIYDADYIIDTFGDFIADVFGAVLAYKYLIK